MHLIFMIDGVLRGVILATPTLLEALYDVYAFCPVFMLLLAQGLFQISVMIAL